jgi:DNA adenine methylase
MINLNSFIPWIGGKKLLRKTIVSYFPDEIDRYIEVFGGAAWVLFYKDKYANLEVYNDINSNLVNLFRCIKYHFQELQKELTWVLNSHEIFDEIRNIEDSKGLTDIQRAARYFTVIKISFGADRRSYGCSKRSLLNSVKYLTAIHERLDKVVIENRSYEALIKVYDRPDALFYLDPPYHGTEKYYDDVFTEQNHIILKNSLKKIKGKFILSYNDDEYIRELYKDFEIIELNRQKNLTGRTKNSDNIYHELLIKNY